MVMVIFSEVMFQKFKYNNIHYISYWAHYG